MGRASAVAFAALAAAAAQPAAAAVGGLERGHQGEQAPILFSADEVQYDEDLGLVVAKGHVELSQREQILLADTVSYNQRTDTVTASGHVSLLQPNGDILFGDFMELHDNLHDGFIQNVRLLLADRSRMAGNTARRIDANRTEIRRGVYSACEPCREDPTRAPIWQIKAEDIVHDKQLQLVEYRDAVVEIDGVPVFWTPYFSHPDPSVKRRSGFLVPSFGPTSSTLGTHVSIPYYWVIDQDKDATITPMFTTAAGTFLGGEYRQRFANGKLTSDDSVTFGSKAATAVDPTLKSGTRWHVDTTGQLDLTPDWRAGGNIMRASDQTYLLRYHLPSPVNFLTSHLYGEHFGERSYGNISAWGFQSLRPGVGDSIEPFAAPLADYQWVSRPDAIGGRLSLEGNALDLVRIQGIDMRRGSFGGEWRLPANGPIGDRYELVVGLRNDGYYSQNLPIAGSAATESALAGRVFPQVALTWHYPWIRRGEAYSQLIEPVVMFAAAPNGGNPGTIPNEDSQGFEFDETSLFRRNRFPGFDRVDSGQRVDYGIRAGIYGDGGGSTRLLVGQSHSLQVNNNFLVGSGLEHHVSDVVGRVTVSPAPYLDFIYRFRLDHEDLALRRQEVTTSTGPANLRLALSYIQIAAIPDVPDLQKRKQVAAILNAGLTRYWSMQLTGVRDFAGVPPAGTATVGTQETLASGIQLTYRDECVTFITTLSQSGIRNGDVLPGTSLLFTVAFKNLGDIGTKLASLGPL
jgi:LPS-assembly protein